VCTGSNTPAEHFYHRYDNEQTLTMAARTKSHKQAVLQSKHSKEFNKKLEAGKLEKKAERDIVIAEHLPPWILTVAILACSGILFVFALRDFWTTGKNIAGGWDESFLVRIVVSHNEIARMAL
jgi:hypothetical protein